MITIQSVREKFEDKGESLMTLYLNLPPLPIFDPSCLERASATKEDLYETYKKLNQWRLDYYNEKLQELNTWIDYQKHK